jgi:hypothetical protein
MYLPLMLRTSLDPQSILLKIFLNRSVIEIFVCETLQGEEKEPEDGVRMVIILPCVVISLYLAAMFGDVQCDVNPYLEWVVQCDAKPENILLRTGMFSVLNNDVVS